MNISVIHPSRNRPGQALNTFKNWTEKADDIFDYILSFDSDQQVLYCNQFEYYHDKLVGLNGPNKTAIEAINSAARVCTGDLLIVISDDFDCPEHWDTLLLKELEGKSDFVLKTQDGIQKTCVTLPIMDRIFYERYGYVYHPGYKHMWADVDLTAVTLMTGKFLKSDLMFEHQHYSTGKTPKDLLNERNNNTWRFGENFLKQRIKENFGIENPVIKYEDIVWK